MSRYLRYPNDRTCSQVDRATRFAKRRRCSVGLMLDDELEMIAFLNRIRDAAVMLDLQVPGWWLVPDAVDQILTAELVERPDYLLCGRSGPAGFIRTPPGRTRTAQSSICTAFPAGALPGF